MAPPSRETLAIAIGRILFLRLSKEDAQQLFREAGAAPDWSLVAHFTRQAVRDAGAAATIATLFVNECAVLDSVLEPQMFLGGMSMCVADLACYVALIAAFSSFPDRHKWALCSVSRWFDHMQHAVDALNPPAELGTATKVEFNLDPPWPLPTVASLPLLVRAPGGGAADAVAATPDPTGGGGGGAAASGAAAGAADESKQGKSAAREKKEAEKATKKDKKGAEAAPAPAPAEDGQSDVSKLDIRVGLIISAERHPEAEKLYVEKVDVGEEKPRTVVSGLVDFMPAEALTNRRAVLLCNLKPAKMRGIESQAMVLAASNADHTIVELLTPPTECKVGERIMFSGHPGEPLPPNQIAKKKVWEAVAPHLGTNDECVAQYKGLAFDTTHGPCTVATIKSGGIK